MVDKSATRVCFSCIKINVFNELSVMLKPVCVNLAGKVYCVTQKDKSAVFSKNKNKKSKEDHWQRSMKQQILMQKKLYTQFLNAIYGP
jgi:hypothetical protein